MIHLVILASKAGSVLLFILKVVECQLQSDREPVVVAEVAHEASYYHSMVPGWVKSKY